MELKDYSKYYIQGSDHYLISKDVFVELFNEMINWKEETIKLKKQLENNSKINIADHKYASECEDKVIVLENQQKKFMNYLKDIINWEPVVIEKILQRYKEIIEEEK